MHGHPWRVPQRGQELWLRQLAPLDGDRRAEDLPVVADEEQLQGDELGRAARAGCGRGRRPSQGGDERAQAAIGCPLGEDSMLVPVCKPDGRLAQDGGLGREPRR
jgi:hypothetical protein